MYVLLRWGSRVSPALALHVLAIIHIIMCNGSTVNALVCQSCDPDSCPPDPGNCTAGVVTDICGCCKECAKSVNQVCGGPFGLRGRCGKGLECAILPKEGVLLTGSEEGICREIIPKQCDKSKCGVTVKRKCPADSILVQNDTDDCCKVNFQCVCNLALCKKETCVPGFDSVLHHKAEGHPGACCDQYVCQPSEKCKSIMCPWTWAKECPPDSYRLPSVPTEDGCCYQPQSCECSTCPPVTCRDGLQVQIIDKGKEKPGRCCTRFRCVNETNLNCYNDLTSTLHKDGESWKPDKCSICNCRHGITFCKRETCHNITICPYMEIPENACCPVCKGCMTEFGEIVNNSETWTENDCTTCTCVDGKAQCNSQMCETKCLNPRKIPGQCCPVCEEDNSKRQPAYCPSLHNCTLVCPSGYMFTEQGCYTCKCKPDNCYMDCRYGYKMDSQGKEICECAKPEQKCPSLEACTKQCTYGFKKSRNGCLKCRCNKCPLLKCSKRCALGYVVNDQGCHLCKCQGDSPTIPPSTESSLVDMTTDEGPPDKSCLSLDGQRREDGDSWHDGCRLCYCYSGREMCALISCPRPSCKSPIFRVGDCCPTCPGNSILPPSTGARESCQSADGRYFVEGESWYLDNCTECMCHNGSILCETHTCPPLLCSFPRILPDRCCPVCQDDAKKLPNVEAPQKRMCRTEGGFTYLHGDIWRTNPCQSCTCRNGQIHCFSQTCPLTACAKTVLRKGNCCPTCIEFEHPRVCTDGEVTYGPREQWLAENCSKCYCLDGEKLCIHIPCPVPKCKYLVKPPNQCCPVCLDMASVNVSSTSARPKDVVTRVDTEKDPHSSNENTTVIICVLAFMVLVLLLLFVFCAYKFHRRRLSAQKNFVVGCDELDNVKPVQVKLLGYETGEKVVVNSDKAWTEGILTPLHKPYRNGMGKMSEEERKINLLSSNFDKNNCVIKGDIYL